MANINNDENEIPWSEHLHNQGLKRAQKTRRDQAEIAGYRIRFNVMIAEVKARQKLEIDALNAELRQETEARSHRVEQRLRTNLQENRLQKQAHQIERRMRTAQTLTRPTVASAITTTTVRNGRTVEHLVVDLTGESRSQPTQDLHDPNRGGHQLRRVQAMHNIAQYDQRQEFVNNILGHSQVTPVNRLAVNHPTHRILNPFPTPPPSPPPTYRAAVAEIAPTTNPVALSSLDHRYKPDSHAKRARPSLTPVIDTVVAKKRKSSDNPPTD